MLLLVLYIVDVVWDVKRLTIADPQNVCTQGLSHESQSRVKIERSFLHWRPCLFLPPGFLFTDYVTQTMYVLVPRSSISQLQLIIYFKLLLLIHFPHSDTAKCLPSIFLLSTMSSTKTLQHLQDVLPTQARCCHQRSTHTRESTDSHDWMGGQCLFRSFHQRCWSLYVCAALNLKTYSEYGP